MGFSNGGMTTSVFASWNEGLWVVYDTESFAGHCSLKYSGEKFLDCFN